jgi:hypothetical protein
MSSRHLLVVAAFGLIPISVLADEIVVASGPPVVAHEARASAPPIANTYHAPFGYFQTHWRPFPIPQTTLPKPATIPPSNSVRATPDPMPPAPPPTVSKPVPEPTKTAEARPMIRGPQEPVPTPHPASVKPKPFKPEPSFATLRTPRTAAPDLATRSTPTPTRNPVIDSSVRPSRYDDGVIRPDWPVLPPLKK